MPDTHFGRKDVAKALKAAGHCRSEDGGLAIVDVVLGAIYGALMQGQAVQLPRFGTFEQTVLPAVHRQITHPTRGEIVIDAPARRGVKFKPSQALKDALRGR